MKLTKQHLTTEEIINSSDFIISLTADVDAILFGLLEFSNGSKKVIQFVKSNNDSLSYKGRLILYPEDLEFLESSLFHIECVNGELSQKTNVVKLSFDKEKIKLNIRKEASEQYKSILILVKQLEEKISSLTTGKVLQSLPIKNKNMIKPGMIPVAIDEKGNFVAMYPFANLISSINGHQGIDGAIKLDASMIEYKENGDSIKEAIEKQTEAIQALKHLIDQIADNQKQIRQQLNEVDMKIESHINNGII